MSGEQAHFQIRKRKVLYQIPFEKLKGLEFGPLDRPLVLKSEGDISYLDYMSQDRLRAHYKGTSVQVDAIQPVDYVIEGRLSDSSLPQKAFDYIIASHVAEHVPDLISWLQDLSQLLREGGVVSLVLPDKRFTFDRNRSLSLPKDLIEAHLGSYQRPSPGQVYDFIVNEAKVPSRWKLSSIWRFSSIDTVCSPMQALTVSEQSAQSSTYTNVHCWSWTPQSFLLILKFLFQIGKTDFYISHFQSTAFHDLEFFVQLKKMPSQMQRQEAQAIQMKSLPKFIGEIPVTSIAFQKCDRLCLSEYLREFSHKIQRKLKKRF